MALTMLPTANLIDTDEQCKENSFLYQHFLHTFQQNFAFESYRVLVEKGFLPELATQFRNGSLCKEYVRNYVSFVSVESPTTSVIKSKREKRISFNDQLGTIGGTLGLFTGMSLLSIIEIFFLILNLVYTILKTITGNSNVNSVIANDEAK